MLPEIAVNLYVRTDFLKFQEMIFKFPRKFVRLDFKSTFPVLENSGSVREGFKNLLLNSPVKGVPPAPLTELILLPKKFAMWGVTPSPLYGQMPKEGFQNPSWDDLSLKFL